MRGKTNDTQTRSMRCEVAGEDDWTPIVGWRKAAMELPLRLIVALAVSWAGLWSLERLMRYLAEQAGADSLSAPGEIVIVFGAVAGVIAGVIMSRKLAERTGLLGKQLILPVYMVLVTGLVALHKIIGHVRADWHGASFLLLGACGIAGCLYAGVRLYLDS